MSPTKISLNETERLKSVLLNAKLAKLDKEELVFELNEVKKSSSVEGKVFSSFHINIFYLDLIVMFNTYIYF